MRGHVRKWPQLIELYDIVIRFLWRHSGDGGGATLLKVSQFADVDAVAWSFGQSSGEIHGAEFTGANPGQHFVDADAPLTVSLATPDNRQWFSKTHWAAA